jgi:hypothetical protein
MHCIAYDIAYVEMSLNLLILKKIYSCKETSSTYFNIFNIYLYTSCAPNILFT